MCHSAAQRAHHNAQVKAVRAGVEGQSTGGMSSCWVMRQLLCCHQVLALSRDAFERLMGPVDDILAEQIKTYDRRNSM